MAMNRARDARGRRLPPNFRSADRARARESGEPACKVKNGGWARVRRRQHLLVPEPHPVRRPRRAARPANRRRDRALRLHAGATRGAPGDEPALKRGVDNLIADQEADGSWFGRWGMNYIYGTWSALCALNAATSIRIRSGAARRQLARFDPELGRWLGRGGRRLQLEYVGYDPRPAPHRRRPGRSLRCWRWARMNIPRSRGVSPTSLARRRMTGCGPKSALPPPGSLGSSTSGITAMRSSFRFGRLPAIEILSRATAAPSPSECQLDKHSLGAPARSGRHRRRSRGQHRGGPRGQQSPAVAPRTASARSLKSGRSRIAGR